MLDGPGKPCHKTPLIGRGSPLAACDFPDDDLPRLVRGPLREGGARGAAQLSVYQ